MLKVISVLFVTSAMTLFSGQTNAMQFNVTLGDDLKTNQRPVNIAFKLYYNTPGGGFSMFSEKLGGLASHAVMPYIASLKYQFSDKIPMNDAYGRNSQITLGFKKEDDADVYPASCQNIKLQLTTNIIFTETGCIVS